MRQTLAIVAGMSLAVLVAAPALGQPGVCTSFHAPLTFDPDALSQVGAGTAAATQGETFACNLSTWQRPSIGVFRKIDGQWVQEPFADLTSDIGWDPARSLVIVGDTLYAGNIGNGTGSVDVYTRTALGGAAFAWSLTTRVTKTTPRGSNFGASLAVQGDDMFVGMRGPSGSPGNGPGVYLFQRDASGEWSAAGSIIPADTNGTQHFGASLAVDGDTLVVGSPASDSNGVINNGAAYVFQRVGGTWTQVARLNGDSTPMHFGISVAISGGAIAAGAYRDEVLAQDTAGLQPVGGYARVYEQVNGVWTQVAQFASPNTRTSGFGRSVALRPGRLLVGAYLDDPAMLPDAGAAYQYVRMNGQWTESGMLVRGGAAEWAGYSLAMSDDYVVVGKPNVGKVDVYDRCALPPTPVDPPRCIPTMGGLITFIMAWFNAAPFGDFDGNGSVDTADLFAYINAWVAGCP